MQDFTGQKRLWGLNLLVYIRLLDVEIGSRNCSRNLFFFLYPWINNCVFPEEILLQEFRQKSIMASISILWLLITIWGMGEGLPVKEAALFLPLLHTSHSYKCGEHIIHCSHIDIHTKIIPPTLEIKYRMTSEIWTSNKEWIIFSKSQILHETYLFKFTE